MEGPGAVGWATTGVRVERDIEGGRGAYGGGRRRGGGGEEGAHF